MGVLRAACERRCVRLRGTAGRHMIGHSAFVTEPWSVRETSLDFETLAQTESVFALSNGHIGWRGNLDEGEPYGLPGSYLNGVFEIRPLPYAERGYGNPESGQTIINVTNGKVMRLLVNDEPFDVRYGQLRSHERCLDFRAGVLSRQAEWVSPWPGSERDCGVDGAIGRTGRCLSRRSRWLGAFHPRQCPDRGRGDGPR